MLPAYCSSVATFVLFFRFYFLQLLHVMFVVNLDARDIGAVFCMRSGLKQIYVDAMLLHRPVVMNSL